MTVVTVCLHTEEVAAHFFSLSREEPERVSGTLSLVSVHPLSWSELGSVSVHNTKKILRNDLQLLWIL